MMVRCSSCQRRIGVNLGGNEAREEVSGYAALAGTCDPHKRGNAPCAAAQRYEELKRISRLEAAECP